MVIKTLATTLGETAGDAVSMSMDLGYLLSTFIFAGIFVFAVTIQIKAREFNPLFYWATIVAPTTVGTTLADFPTRSLGIGYKGGSAFLFALLLVSLVVWYKTMGSVSVSSIDTPKVEMFYWFTIMFSQTLGTALGDWTADTAGIGYLGAAIIFVSMLVLIVLAHYFSGVSKTLLFWAAFIITRPLGAVVGDYIDKPVADGGLALSRYSASITLALLFLACIVIFPQLANKSNH